MFDLSNEPGRIAGLGQVSTLLEGWMPPTRENWQISVFAFQIFWPLTGVVQLLVSWYGMGKTSQPSRLNLPGRFAWFTMECPGFIILLYIMRSLPARQGIDDLPWQNKVLAGLFVIHYMYRAVAFPFLQPSIAPMHVLVWLSALSFQLMNAMSLGSWLAAYGPVTEAAWEEQSSLAQFVLGIAIFYGGLVGNFFHDEELREIRRRERRRQEQVLKQQGGEGNGQVKQKVETHYRIPEAGLFRYVLFPHYFCEWIEWAGFWMAAGFGCVPARTFLFNEICVMLPRAWNGRKWYMEKFGEDKIKKKGVAIPGLF